MNWIDIILVIIFILSIWAGYNRGFILGTMDLLCWGSSFIAAFMLYDYTKILIEKIVSLHVWLLPASFILTLAIARTFFGLLARSVVRLFPERSNTNSLNKFLGVVPGVINGWIIAILVSALLLAI